MGTCTNLYCHLILCRETLDSKSRLFNYIDDVKKDLELYKEDLRALVMTTEPTKMFSDKDSDMSPYEYMKFRFKEDIEGLKDCFYKLWVYDYYLYNWDNCHDEKGVANGMPEFCEDDTRAFMDGDWVDTTKWTRKDYEAKIRTEMNKE